MMDNDTYAKQGGRHCPHCGKDGGIEGWDVEIEYGAARQPVGCTLCGAGWTDAYVLVGYEDLTLDDDH